MMSTMLPQALSFIFTLLALPATLFTYIKEWLHFWRLARRFPGPRPYPIVGNLMDAGFRKIGMDLLVHTADVIAKSRTCTIWIGPQRFLCINDPRDIQCYTQNPKNQNKHDALYKVIEMIMGKGLLVVNGEEWQHFHKIISPAFHQEKFNSCIEKFNQQCDIFIECLDQHKNGETIDIKSMVERFALDLVVGTIMDGTSNEQKNDTGINKLVEKSQEAVCYRLLRPWLYPEAIFNNLSSKKQSVEFSMGEIHKRLDEIIQERVQILNEGRPLKSNSMDQTQSDKKYRRGLVDLLLLQKTKDDKVTDKKMVAEIQTALLAGFDTVFIAVSFTLFLLAKHPDVQDKVLAELRKLFVDKVEITLESLRNMRYLPMVIKESLRVYPPVWFMARVTGEDTPLASSDLVIPAGANVLVSFKSLHSDPELYPNPDVFDPERFSPENCANRHPFAYLPFAAGMRSCIGKKFALMELKCLVSKIIWHYEVRPDPTYEPHLDWGISTYPKNGMRLKFFRR